MHFNTATCPSGWHELTAAAGRVIVGNTGGNMAGLAQTVGAQLADRENRSHTHDVIGETGLAQLLTDCGYIGTGGLFNSGIGCLGVDTNCCGGQ